MVGNLEEKAEKYALPIQGELALIRGKLVCGYSEAKANTLSRKDRGRERQRYTLEQLSDAVMLVEEYFRAARKQFEECEQICGQIIINAYYKGMNRQGQDLYLQVSQDAELAPYLAKVQGVVGCANSRVIFEQAKGYIK